MVGRALDAGLVGYLVRERHKESKDFQTRICVSTDIFGRGIDVERINVAINYDMSDKDLR
jgi:superfamily II DNA/RNA helicase